MKISIITPSLNQVDYIPATIGSILDQNYPELDYIVVDGGSTDGTLDVLRKFGRRFRWVSEPDHGQTDAINKGLRMAEGEVLAYLNADDLYLPGTLDRVAGYFMTHPGAGWLFGHCRLIDESGNLIGGLNAPPFNLRRMIDRAEYVPQPTVFWRRSVAAVVGEFDVSLHYTMDYDYFIRLGRYTPGHRLDAELACFRLQPTSKTIASSEERFWREQLMVSERYGMRPWTAWYWIRRARHRGLRLLPGSWQRGILRLLGRVQDQYRQARSPRGVEAPRR